MNNSLFLWEATGTIVIFILGSFIHFGYELTDKINLFTAIFAVNESVWEHSKLTFWSPLIYALIEYFFIGQLYPNFFISKTLSAIITTITMISLFYTYCGITGHHSLIIDLIIYEISIIIGLIISYKIINMPSLPYFVNKISIFLIIISIIIFYVFSYTPPKLPLFKCDITGKYGV